jgi:hypothetical protein
MSGLCYQAGVPRKGWECIAMDDLGDIDAICQWCGTQEIRYVHTMVHPEFSGIAEVGCVCAEHMGDPYAASREGKYKRNPDKWQQLATVRTLLKQGITISVNERAVLSAMERWLAKTRSQGLSSSDRGWLSRILQREIQAKERQREGTRRKEAAP